MNLLGIDIGTTGVKAAVFEEAGRQLALSYREYGPGTCFELDPDMVFAHLADCIREVASVGAGAVALSVSGDELVPVDRDGRCLYGMIMSLDSRGGEGITEYLRHFSPEELYVRTGLPPHAKYGANRILWFYEHRPELFEKTWRFMTWEDFVWLRLGVAEPAISASTAARLMLYDIHKMSWDPQLLETAHIREDMLSPVVPPGTVIGRIPRNMARELGFPNPPLAVAGGFDQACAALGAGVVSAGDCAVGTGTMESLSVCTKEPSNPGLLLQNHYPCNLHVVPGYYIIGATNPGGGLLVKWLRDEIYADPAKSYAELFFGLPEGPSGLLVLPHFAGSGPPYKDKESLGAVLGLTPHTDRATLLKAVLEGITFELKQNIEALRRCGLEVRTLLAVGGGANSAAWLKLKADITGVPVLKPRVAEAGCFAAAVLAGVGAGVYKSAAEAKDLIAIEREFLPGKAQTKYEPYYELYQKVYPQNRELLHGLLALKRAKNE